MSCFWVALSLYRNQVACYRQHPYASIVKNLGICPPFSLYLPFLYEIFMVCGSSTQTYDLENSALGTEAVAAVYSELHIYLVNNCIHWLMGNLNKDLKPTELLQPTWMNVPISVVLICPCISVLQESKLTEIEFGW